MFIPKFKLDAHEKKTVLNHHRYSLKLEGALCYFLRKKSGRISRHT